ncbi:phosphoribulokinase/uridine kinase [Gregarina niphandrodes]|uniref:Phosphoribulokinase/uridine kinase n=1 Tax=Gregarina niphandrodes TaxID=110365 RepID=A0A023B870_GRENI|nr:phosphoribulokinase/uridine kinase [Gregarina niphandrodes]EZG68471.1 phosphoribulokinase/uridine kinase [Gregarina niphandrodes]|eukprot:XP_011134576.1 phosphoribulokinase/uridine kinase [Gregarina niphandrodes]
MVWRQAVGRVEDRLQKTGAARLVFLLGGGPGSGKTTLAEAVVEQLNSKHGAGYAVVVGMDGYHIPRACLSGEELRRRGAPWTIDGVGFVEAVKSLKRAWREEQDLWLPMFDHSTKDPVKRSVCVPKTAQVVVVEGLYVLLSTAPWNQVRTYADEAWYLPVDDQVAKERLAKRHFRAGIVSSLEEGRIQTELNDEKNARIIRGQLNTEDVIFLNPI